MAAVEQQNGNSNTANTVTTTTTTTKIATEKYQLYKM